MVFEASRELTGVYALDGIQLCIPIDLGTANKNGLNPDQLSDGEGQPEVEVSGGIQLHLPSINPASMILALTTCSDADVHAEWTSAA